MELLLQSLMHLSEDFADFMELPAVSTLKNASLAINTYIDKCGLAEGPLPLLGGTYPGPLIHLDMNLTYLFRDDMEELGVNKDRPIAYSKFKALCLKHMKMM